jgi:hypothetical protein
MRTGGKNLEYLVLSGKKPRINGIFYSSIVVRGHMPTSDEATKRLIYTYFMTREQQEAWIKANPDKAAYALSILPQNGVNQFHQGWLTPLLRARGNVQCDSGIPRCA